MIKVALLLHYYKALNQWWIQEFQNRRPGPGAVDFLGSENCFGAPSNILYLIKVREKSKMTIVNVQTGRREGGIWSWIRLCQQLLCIE